jgi:WD40 repeat protein
MLKSLFMARVKMAAAALSLILMIAGLGSILRDALAAPQRPNPAPVAAAGPPSPPVDCFGDPLPKYARARMGTVRFNEGAFVRQALYTPDGKSLVTVTGNQAVHVWDVATGRIVRTIGNPESQFREIAISADGLAMATIEEVPGPLRLWDLASGRERRRWHGTREANYHRLTFSPDGKTVAAATTWYNEIFIHLWDTTAPTERRRRIEGSRPELWDIVFSPDGRTLATASDDPSERAGADRETGSIQLWDIASARELRRFPIEGFGVRSVAFSRDGKRLFAGVTDRTIRAFDLATGRETTPRLGQEHAIPPRVKGGAIPVAREEINCLEFSPDGSILASTTLSTASAGPRALAEIHLWDVVRGTELRRIPAHGQWIMSLSFAPDGKTIASTGAEPVIRLWDVATGRAVSPQAGHRSGVQRLIISPADGTLFTSAYSDGTIRRWGPSTGRELGLVADFLGVISALAMSPDGQTLVVGDSMGRKLFLWSVAERREIRRFPRVPVAEHNYVNSASFSADGKMVAAELRVWDVASGRVLATFRDQQAANDFMASSIPIFPTSDGRRVITVEKEGIRIWEIASGKEVRWAVRSKIHNKTAALSPDGRLLATGGVVVRDDERRAVEFDPAIRLWELASGKEVATLEGHEASTHGLAFSPDGKLMASCSGGSQTINDQTVRVWDLTTGREQRRFEGHRGAVNAVVFTPDGRSVVSGSEDATALVWDISGLKDNSKTDELLTPESLQARWDELAGNDARAAYRAAWALSAPSAVGFLGDHLKVATMAETIIATEVLRSLRAITALEHVHTPEARAVIERLTQGAPDAITTREAKATLERLNHAIGR